jgi:tRNA pseudouridine55 synthase
MKQDIHSIDFQEGAVLLFDKPLDWTSFDVVNKVRWLLCRKLKVKKLKVGHAGTLDPKATGLVVVCTGKATKMIEQLQATEKCYRATLKLGATTPSFDCETDEDVSFPTEHIIRSLVEEVISRFVGEIEQVPPVFSAIKVNGKRAFDYARKGKELELDARKVTIFEIRVESFELPELKLMIRCSKGTYIRSLARDIGLALSSGAYLTGLQRTRSGELNLDEAWSIESFEQAIQTL